LETILSLVCSIYHFVNFARRNAEFRNTLEVVSKAQIGFKGKAQADRESAVRHTFWRMSIYRRSATQPLGLRWGFETASMQIPYRLRSTLAAGSSEGGPESPGYDQPSKDKMDYSQRLTKQGRS
jgi:hypothetical protein